MCSTSCYTGNSKELKYTQITVRNQTGPMFCNQVFSYMVSFYINKYAYIHKYETQAIFFKCRLKSYLNISEYKIIVINHTAMEPTFTNRD